MDGRIFEIQRFSLFDGPGIRTTVFFKGCNMRCLWCHNPESQSPDNELTFYNNKCVSCGECLKFCAKTFSSECTACGRCADVCAHGARKIIGVSETADYVSDTVIRDKEFFQTSNGGITLSGGEPLLQPQFAAEILSACKARGINTAIETAANVDWASIKEILPYTDLIICDVKGIDNARHKINTGVENALILSNAELLKSHAKSLLFRMPVVPNYNADELNAVAAFTKGFPLELMSYHNACSAKYAALNRPFLAADVQPLSNEEMQALAKCFGAIYNPNGLN